MGLNGARPGVERDIAQRVVDHAANPFMGMDHDGHVLWASKTVADIFGRTADDIVGTHVLDLVHESSRARVLTALQDVGRFDGTEVVRPFSGTGPVFHVQTATGAPVACEVTVAAPARTGLDHFVIQLRRAAVQAGINDALKAMGSMAPVEDVLRLLVASIEASELGVRAELLHDRVQDVFRACTAPTQRLLDEPSLRRSGPWVDVLRAGTMIDTAVDELDDPIRSMAEEAGHVGCWTFPVRDGVGREYAASLVVWHGPDTPLTNVGRQVLESAAEMVTFVFQWNAGVQGLAHDAEHDALTGLANRRGLVRQFSEIGLGHPVTILYLDLDDFKRVNDDIGHRAGDEVLAVVGKRLEAAIRPRDIVGRVGGDEFVVVCRGPGTPDTDELADRLIEAVARPISVPSSTTPVEVGASIGVAADDGSAARDLFSIIDRADTLLRDAKREGKATFRRET